MEPPRPCLQQGADQVMRVPGDGWNRAADNILMGARQMGMSFPAIVAEHFPDRTRQALRKRYDKLRNGQVIYDDGTSPIIALPPVRRREPEMKWEGPSFDQIEGCRLLAERTNALRYRIALEAQAA